MTIISIIVGIIFFCIILTKNHVNSYCFLQHSDRSHMNSYCFFASFWQNLIVFCIILTNNHNDNNNDNDNNENSNDNNKHNNRHNGHNKHNNIKRHSVYDDIMSETMWIYTITTETIWIHIVFEHNNTQSLKINETKQQT